MRLVPLSFDSTGGEKNKKTYKELSHSSMNNLIEKTCMCNIMKFSRLPIKNFLKRLGVEWWMGQRQGLNENQRCDLKFSYV